MTVAPGTLTALRNQLNEARRLFQLLPLDSSDARDNLTKVYVATIVEMAGGCITLAEARQYSGVEVLIRTAMEAYIDLRCLDADPSFVDIVQYRDLKECLSTVTGPHAHHNDAAFRAAMEANSGTAVVQRWQAELKEVTAKLAESGSKPKTPTKPELFAKAGRMDLYPFTYNRLCAASHNNQFVLTVRHIKVNPMSGETGIALHNQDYPFANGAILVLIEFLGDSLRIIARRFGVRYEPLPLEVLSIPDETEAMTRT
jgi:hypothetical protein